MRRLYLILALLGAIGPYFFFIQYFSIEGLDLSAFISAFFENGAVAGIFVDVVLASLAFWVIMYRRQREGKGPNPIPFMLINLLIGLACAVPAYMYVRERELDRKLEEGQ